MNTHLCKGRLSVIMFVTKNEENCSSTASYVLKSIVGRPIHKIGVNTISLI
jgi:hypothetical protein